MKLPLDPKRVIDAPKPVVDRLAQHRDSAFNRFPLLFTLLGTAGVAITFYGIEHLIDKTSFLANHPIISLLVGLLILILTGSLYKKL